MSNFAQKDIDKHNRERTLGDFIFPSFENLLGELRQPTEREIGDFNENTENRKHEMYHQGQDEVGELMRLTDEYDPLGEEEEDGHNTAK